MKTLNYSFVRTVCALVIGLVLVLWPDAASDYIVITIGILFMIPGLIGLINYFAVKSRHTVVRGFPIQSIGSLLFGLWLLIMPAFFADILMFVLGVLLMAGGIQQLVHLVVARRWIEVPGVFYILPVLIVIAGGVILFNPTAARHTTLIMIGIASMVYALGELIAWFRFLRLRPQKTAGRGDIQDVEIIE